MHDDYKKKAETEGAMRSGFRCSLIDAPYAPSRWYEADGIILGGEWHRVIIHDRGQDDELFRSARNVYDELSPESRHLVNLRVVLVYCIGIIYVPQTKELMLAHIDKWNRHMYFKHI
jgi:hypothetical protein